MLNKENKIDKDIQLTFLELEVLHKLLSRVTTNYIVDVLGMTFQEDDLLYNVYCKIDN